MLTRRALLTALAVAAGGRVTAEAGAEGRVFPLWPGVPPGGEGPSGGEEVDAHGARRNIVRPRLTLFEPARMSDTVFLIASGGGYRRIEDGKEALPAARWLTAHGYAAAVLDYRLPGEGWTPEAPVQDARRALRLLRSGAALAGMRRVGVLGFSAGAHLLALAAGNAPLGGYDRVDAADEAPARADLAAFIYPVLSLSPDLRPTSAQKMLIGRDPSPALAATWSADTHVDAHFPPAFLVQALDDPVSDPRQAPLMADACARAGVPVELHMLASGGHGFGMGRVGASSAQWPAWFADRLARAPARPG